MLRAVFVVLRGHNPNKTPVLCSFARGAILAPKLGEDVMSVLILLAVIVVVGRWLVGIYNGLVTARQSGRNSFYRLAEGPQVKRITRILNLAVRAE